MSDMLDQTILKDLRPLLYGVQITERWQMNSVKQELGLLNVK